MASATGIDTGAPDDWPVPWSTNRTRMLPKLFGIDSISCCSFDFSATAVRCRLLGGGKTVAIASRA